MVDSFGGNVHVTGRRVVATIADGVILGVSGGMLASLLGIKTSSVSSFDLTQLSTGGSFLLFAYVVLYYVVLEGLTGRTVGKFLAGIRVIEATTGRPPGVGRAVVRTLLRLIDGILAYLVGFVIVLASRHRRRLGDMAAGTLVVRA